MLRGDGGGGGSHIFFVKLEPVTKHLVNFWPNFAKLP